jgi:hypothetical protein
MLISISANPPNKLIVFYLARVNRHTDSGTISALPESGLTENGTGDAAVFGLDVSPPQAAKPPAEPTDTFPPA